MIFVLLLVTWVIMEAVKALMALWRDWRKRMHGEGMFHVGDLVEHEGRLYEVDSVYSGNDVGPRAVIAPLDEDGPVIETKVVDPDDLVLIQSGRERDG